MLRTNAGPNCMNDQTLFAEATRSLCLVGGGKMGVALLEGWLRALHPGPDIVVVDPRPGGPLTSLADTARARVVASFEEASRADTIVFAVKPQVAVDVLSRAAPAVGDATTVISIMAGISLASLRRHLPKAGAIVRAMPNLPASVGRGVTVGIAEPGTGDYSRAEAEQLLGATGSFEWLTDESHIDIATGLSGSGPAYVYYLVDCLAEAASKLGLPPGTAERLSRLTVVGAGELLHRSGQTAQDLRIEVTSPNGTTEAGLHVLMDGRFQEVIDATVRAAATRSRQLAGV